MSASSQFEIAICGAGPVGLALAAMLLARGKAANSIVLIDAKSLATAEQDPRSIALSHGSHDLLQQVGAWPAASTPITQIHISRRESFGRTLIDSAEYDLPALGYVCRYGLLVQALAQALAERGITMLRPATVVAVEETDQCVLLQMADDSRLQANVMVQAEGGVFGTQTAKTVSRDYQQNAIVAHIHCSAPVAGRAFERFTDEGPLALLPQDDGYALVWCVRPATMERLLALSDADFLQALQQAFGQRVGQFTATDKRNSYPLGLNANPAGSNRIAAIGNAAQTLHPVAGQGLNLGLRDAAVLAALLARSASPETLAHFHVNRRNDRKLTLHLTDTMARVFASAPDAALSQHLLGLALGIVDVLPSVKKSLAGQMMFGWR